MTILIAAAPAAQRQEASRHLPLVAAFTIITLAVPGALWASCPAPGPICDAYERAALVFVADVVSIVDREGTRYTRPGSGPAQPGPTRSGAIAHITFTVLDRFKGTIADHAALDWEPSSEDFDYAVGQRVLVYASRTDKVWSTACTRTRQVSSTDPELSVIRALRDKRPRGGVIEGQVPQLFRPGDRTSAIRVIVRRQGKTIDQFLPGTFGRFTTGWLEPGTYVLSVEDGPKGLIGRREVAISADSTCVSIDFIVDRASPR